MSEVAKMMVLGLDPQILVEHVGLDGVVKRAEAMRVSQIIAYVGGWDDAVEFYPEISRLLTAAEGLLNTLRKMKLA